MSIRNVCILFLTVILASCSGLFTPYKMDIRQGNYVTPEMREKLKIGMTRSQVKYVLGTPMVSDVFHDNRWDYVYSLEHKGEQVERQRLTLFFKGENLERMVEGEKTFATIP